jgi:hypothetical protein
MTSSSTSVIFAALATISFYYSFTNHAVLSFPIIVSTNSKTRPSKTLSSVGNFIAGVTNNPPSTLLSSESLKVSLVDGTSLQNKPLARIYKASKDGWTATDFHNNVDEKGSCLVVALTRSGILFGAFNPVSAMLLLLLLCIHRRILRIE